MRYVIGILLLAQICFAQDEIDPHFIELQNVPIDSMSDREYEFYMEYMRNHPDILKPKTKPTKAQPTIQFPDSNKLQARIYLFGGIGFPLMKDYNDMISDVNRFFIEDIAKEINSVYLFGGGIKVLGESGYFALKYDYLFKHTKADISSNISCHTPAVGVGIQSKDWGSAPYFGVYAGYGFLKYTEEADGFSDFDVKGNAFCCAIELGLETAVGYRAFFFFGLSYKFRKFTKLKYEGDDIFDHPELDLSGIYLSTGFGFW